MMILGALALLLSLGAMSAPTATEPSGVVRTGLSDNQTPATAPIPNADDRTAAPAAPRSKPSCSTDVSFMQGLKYGAEDSNVLDVASTPTERSAKRPIVVFLTGGFGEGNGPTSELVAQAMCFAADHGLVAFRVRYPGADQVARPEGAKDAAAAISWVFENADLFAGSAQEIVVIGFAAGASHLVDVVIRKRFVIDDACVAGLVLVSGVFRSADGAADRWNELELEKIAIPIVLAWSASDVPDRRNQNEEFEKALCNAGHCPRTAVLESPDTPASVFDLDGVSPDLHQRLRQMIGQLDARGLP